MKIQSTFMRTEEQKRIDYDENISNILDINRIFKVIENVLKKVCNNHIYLDENNGCI